MYNKSEILAHADWLTDVMLFDETDSTQREAKEAAQANTLYLTERQTATYGRFGREYFAADAGGIYMSVCLAPESQLTDLPEYTLLAAAAVVTAVEALTDKKPTIKWVNDIYLADKKIAGILTEARLAADGTQQIILGMGINFAIAEFPEQLTARATSLFAADEKPTITREALVGEIWHQFQKLSAGRVFFEIYKSHSFILGKEISFTQNSVSYEGRANGLTDKGELMVQLADGSEMTLNSGEISLTNWQ